MDKEIALALINPATLSRSRTGGILARYLGRTDLQLISARMFAPSKDLATRFADLIEKSEAPDKASATLLANYVRAAYAPDSKSGLPRRVMLLVFEGKDAVAKVLKATGPVAGPHCGGLTIRDTYGDYVTDESGKVTYVEPAVLVAPNAQAVMATLKLWSEFAKPGNAFVSESADVPKGSTVQRTLVMLKPDNFRVNSGRPGHVIDVLSSSGLRIVAAKRFGMSVAQAEEFYGPVKDVLTSKFKKIAGKGVAAALFKELGCEVPDAAMDPVYSSLAPYFATNQFDNIVEFMTGLRPSACTEERKRQPGTASCLALIYEGEDAVATIRTILGATNPKDALPGTIRSEFAINVMVNAAHASDAPESVTRELGILKIEEDTLSPLYEQYRSIMGK